jgi:hypothetical protein
MDSEKITRRTFNKTLGVLTVGAALRGNFSLDYQKKITEAAINKDEFFINGCPTYEGRSWNNYKIQGLLLNSRMVQGIFDDLNPETRHLWNYPDTGKWDPERNTREFVASMAEWKKNGLRAFTINLQGGSPKQGLEGKQLWHNSAIDEHGTLRTEYMMRLKGILDKSDQLGMVAIVGVYYWGQDQRLKDEESVKRGIDNTVDWIFENGWRNVMIEINNECDVYYEHDILKPDRVSELIDRVKKISHNGRRLLVSTSFSGGVVPPENVVRSADYILIHGNGVKNPEIIVAMVRKTRKIPGYQPKPVVFNEDDHYDFEKPMNNFVAALSEYSSWGYFDMGKNNYADGYQSVPANWGINTDRKKSFFMKVKEVSGVE